MNKVIHIAFIVVLCLFFSCGIEPERINYGTDACSFCKMTIVDQQHAAQYVKKKGKQLKFDAIECMVNELGDKGGDYAEILLVADYMQPGIMHPAQEAKYLISKKIKSPMGANLTGFASEQHASEAQKENGGKLYSWKELLKKFDVE